MNAIKTGLKVVLLPVLFFACLVQSKMLNAPVYTGGPGGLAAMAEAYTFLFSFTCGGMALWLYCQLFNFNDGGKLKISFLFGFVGYLIPYIVFSINYPDTGIAAPRDWRQYYFTNDGGNFISFILMGLMLALSRLDINKKLFAQWFTAFIASKIISDIMLGIYDLCISNKDFSFLFHNICVNIYSLIPEYIEGYLPKDDYKGFYKDWFDIFLFFLCITPFMASAIHKIFYILFCRKKMSIDRKTENFAIFFNITYCYLLLILFLTIFYQYFLYLFTISSIFYIFSIWFFIFRKERKSRINIKNIFIFFNITYIYSLSSLLLLFCNIHFPCLYPTLFVMYLISIWYWIVRKIIREREAEAAVQQGE